MTISSVLFNSLLAMDAYNRGYNVGMVVPGGNQLGTATRIDQSDILSGTPGYDAGFYAEAYNWDGQTIVSYRGTDTTGELLTTDFGLWNGDYTSAQAKLAIDFYNQVKANPLATATLSGTGHSLGGALAGFVAATQGTSAVLLDNIDFERAANEAYTEYQLYLNNQSTPTNDIIDLFNSLYHGQLPTVTSFLQIESYYLPGTIAANVRDNVDTATYPIANVLSSTFSQALSSIQLHSQALDVIMEFAEENGYLTWGGSGADAIDEDKWVSMAKQLLPALFGDAVGSAAGFDDSGTNGTGSNAWKLMNAVAYSVVDEGTMPFGDVAIKSLFDDANDISNIALASPDDANNHVVQAFSEIAVQYSGFLAKQAATDPDLLSGAISWDGTHLTADLSTDLWTAGSFVTAHIVGLEDALAGAMLPGAFVPGLWDATSTLQNIFRADTDALISGFKEMIATSAASDTLDASTVSGGVLLEGASGGGTSFVGGTGTNVMVGYGASNNFDLSTGNNIVVLSNTGTANLNFANAVVPGGDGPPASQWSMVEGTTPGTNTGNDTFVFSSTNTAPLTVVYGAGGSDTFDFESDGTTQEQVYLLQMDDINSQNFLSLDPSKIESYIDNTYSGIPGYGAKPTDKIVIINPTADDVLKYNSGIVSDPTRYQSYTNHYEEQYSDFSLDNAQFPVNVDANNPLSTTAPDGNYIPAYFSDLWTHNDTVTNFYGLKSNNTSISDNIGYDYNSNLPQNTISLRGIGGPVQAPDLDDETFGGSQFSNYDNHYYYGRDAGSLYLQGFNDGDFGINLAAANGNLIDDHNIQHTTTVTDWLEGNVDYSGSPYFTYSGTHPVVTGTTPGTFGDTFLDMDQTDDLVDTFGKIIDPDALANYQRANLSVMNFQRDAAPAPAAMSAVSQRMSTASAEGPASTASAKSSANDSTGRSTPPLWKSENERVAQLQQKGLDATGKPNGGFGGWGQGQSADDNKTPELTNRLWNSLGIRQDAGEKSSSGWGALGAMPEAGVRLVSLLFDKDEIKLFADAIPGTNSYQMTDGTALLVSDAASAYRSFGSSAT